MNTQASPSEPAPPKGRMSIGQRLLFFLVAWLICLMPFLFWWNTWFGRPLDNKQLTEYLHDEKKPRHIQHALVQIGERMAKKDAGVQQWYPDLVRLSGHHDEEVRNTDAWVMGQDTNTSGFHEALLKMLDDPSPIVRGNAALSLVRFGDPSGRAQIVALLQPARIVAPSAGKVSDASVPGTVIHQGGIIAKLEGDGKTTEVRSPISGRLQMATASGRPVSAGDEIATVTPTTEQAWEALRALYLVGQMDDVPAILPYERATRDIPDHVREQAVLAEKAIRERAAGGNK
jgi:HEAT repeat